MSPRSPQKHDDFRVMPWWFVLVGLGLALLAGWLVLTWLLGEAERGDSRAALRIDAIRTGLTVVAGTGGAAALLLAARRQWVNERAQRHEELVTSDERRHRERAQEHLESVAAANQRHQDRQAATAEHDATERRVTELYTKAVDLLGNDRPAVRTGGLFALERLAQDHAGHRQTIVDVVCAYLRMPAASDDELEGQVRSTAHRLLTRHLRPEAGQRFWPGIRLDLAGARLAEIDLARCEVDTVELSGARLAGLDLSSASVRAVDLTGAGCAGAATFTGAVVAGALRLPGAVFEAEASFDQLRVGGEASFDGASFAGLASFERAEFAAASFQATSFADAVLFKRTTFQQPTSFDRARFTGAASFTRAAFEAGASIEHADFAGTAHFWATRFAGMVLLRWSVFHQDVTFERARFDDALNLTRVEFHRSVRFEGATLRRPPLLEQTRAAAGALHSWPAGCRTEPVDDDWLLLVPDGRSV